MLWLQKLKNYELCWDEGGYFGGGLFIVGGGCLDVGGKKKEK